MFWQIGFRPAYTKNIKKKLDMSHGNYQKPTLTPSHKVSYLSFSKQCEEKGPITFKARSNPELIIKSILEHFPYLKFGNSFRLWFYITSAVEFTMPYLWWKTWELWITSLHGIKMGISDAKIWILTHLERESWPIRSCKFMHPFFI